MPKALSRLTLQEQAEKVLREMIVSHRFTPGKWINVERLAKDLGVSRTPVSLALKNLEKEGLVSHVPNRGIRMAQMTLEMARDLYAVRGLLEGLAGRLAAANISKRSLARLAQLLEQQREHVSGQDVLGYSKADFAFHGLIYESCDNWLLQELLANIKARSRPFELDITPILPDLYEDHVQVCRALGERSADEAERLMRQHNLRMECLIDDARRVREIGTETPSNARRGQAPAAARRG